MITLFISIAISLWLLFLELCHRAIKRPDTQAPPDSLCANDQPLSCNHPTYPTWLYSSAEERVCSLLVLNSVTYRLQGIRQRKPRDAMLLKCCSVLHASIFCKMSLCVFFVMACCPDRVPTERMCLAPHALIQWPNCSFSLPTDTVDSLQIVK
jgi:hypothetical protein